MPLSCFENEGSSSGRRLCLQVWYFVFYMHQYVQSCMLKCVCVCVFVRERVCVCVCVFDRTHSSIYYTAYTDASKTHYTMP
jgi:hypothetical protein